MRAKNRSEEKLKNTLQYIVLGTGSASVIVLLGYVFMFIFRLIAARALGPEALGMYEVVMTIFGVTTLLAGLGVTTGVTAYLPKYNNKNQSLRIGYLRFITTLPVLTGILFGIILWIFAPIIASAFSTDPILVSFFRFVALLIPLRLLNESLGAILQSMKRPVAGMVGFNIMERVALIIAATIALTRGDGVIMILQGFAIALGVQVAFHCIMLRRLIPEIITSTAKNNMREWMLFSLPLLTWSVFAFILNWTDSLVIATTMPTEQLGLYSIAYNLASALLIFGILFMTVLTPVASELITKNKFLVHKIFERIRTWTLAITAGVGGVLIVFTPTVIQVLFGEAYLPAVTALRILSVAFVLAATLSFSGTVLLITKQTRKLFVINSAWAAINLIALIVIIQLHPTISMVAVITGICMFGARLTEFIQSKKILDVPFYPAKTMRILLALFLTITVAKIISTLPVLTSAGPGWGAIIVGTLYSISYCFLLIRLKIITAEDLALIIPSHR